MKLGFLIPVLDEIDITSIYQTIENSCKEENAEFEILFVLNGDLTNFFTKIRSEFKDNNLVKVLKIDKIVNQHKLITVGMPYCEDYDATIIYSSKEEFNETVIKNFIVSWKTGNKLVYLKKVYSGFKRFWMGIKTFFYKMGISILGVFKDNCAETDIQLLDNDVVKTMNHLPNKNRHLRVLDSFVGYNTDIIYIKVDNDIKYDKKYFDKPRSFYICKTLSYVSLGFSLVFLLILILSLSLSWKVNFIWNLVFLLGFALLGFMYIILATKATLHKRVGDQLTKQELISLTSNMEKYNISNKSTTKTTTKQNTTSTKTKANTKTSTKSNTKESKTKKK